MKLTPQQLKMLRDATKDDRAFEEVLSIFDEASTPSGNTLFDLSPEQTQLVQTVIDTLPIALYFKDTDSHFLMASRITRDRLHVTHHADLVGKTDFDFMDAEIAQENFDIEQTIIKTQTPILNVGSTFTVTLPLTKQHQLNPKSPILDSDIRCITQSILGHALE